MTHVKICGITTVEDAIACADLGASAIGINFVPSSSRYVASLDRARNIAVAANRLGVLVVGVVADMTLEEMRSLAEVAELGCLQLHGHEDPSALTPLLPHAYKAVRIGSAEDVTLARSFPGEHLLVDARVGSSLGGTGETFDWSLVRDLATERKLTLAGGLNPTNVARAIREVNPYCVDVASGVERAPGVKDLDAVRAFIEAASAART